MTKQLKAALVIVHPTCMWGKDTQKDRRERLGRVRAMNAIWVTFEAGRAPITTFWDPYTDKAGDWSPVMQQDLDSKHVIQTTKESSALARSEKVKLSGAIKELEAAGIRDIFFIGGYQMCCMRGIIDYFFPKFRCWVVWDICPSKSPEEFDLKDFEIMRESKPDCLNIVQSESISTRNGLRAFLAGVKPRT